MNRYAGRAIAVVFGTGIAIGIVLSVAVVASMRDDENVRVVTGVVNSVNQNGFAIGLDEDGGDRGEGYIVAGARWKGFDNAWHDSPDPQTGAPTCLEPLTSGQEVRLGVIDARSNHGPSGPVVAWLECLTGPTERWAAAP